MTDRSSAIRLAKTCQTRSTRGGSTCRVRVTSGKVKADTVDGYEKRLAVYTLAGVRREGYWVDHLSSVRAVPGGAGRAGNDAGHP